MAQSLETQLKQSETLVQYLRSTIDQKDERLARAEHELANFRTAENVKINTIQEKFTGQIDILKNELSLTQEQLKQSQEQLQQYQISAKENILLKVQLQKQRDDNMKLRKEQAAQLQRQRDELAEIRANLAAEFDFQLNQQIDGDVKKALGALPEKARAALAENELFRIQFKDLDEQTWSVTQENQKLSNLVKDMTLKQAIEREQQQLIGQQNSKLKRQLEQVQSQNDELAQKQQLLVGQDEICSNLRQQNKQIMSRDAELEEQLRQCRNERKLLQNALNKCCKELNISVQSIYLNPYEVAKTKQPETSILQQKDRFVSPVIM